MKSSIKKWSNLEQEDKSCTSLQSKRKQKKWILDALDYCISWNDFRRPALVTFENYYLYVLTQGSPLFSPPAHLTTVTRSTGYWFYRNHFILILVPVKIRMYCVTVTSEYTYKGHNQSECAYKPAFSECIGRLGLGGVPFEFQEWEVFLNSNARSVMSAKGMQCFMVTIILEIRSPHGAPG
jgi:hypothetical protein